MSKTYKTGEACRVLDVQPYVLRYWETEFSALGGKKPGPHRVYSEDELAILRRIKELLYDEGYTIAGAKKRLESETADAGAAEDPKPTPEPKPRGKKKAAKKQPPSKSSAGKPSAGRPKDGATRKQSAQATAAQTKGTRKKAKATSQAELSIVPAADAHESNNASDTSLDTELSRKIESTQMSLRKLHQEAAELLELVRKAK